MLPRLGGKYEIDIEITSRPKAEYLTDEYFALDLPVAPAIMVGDEIITEGKDIDDHTVEAAICRHLGLPEPEQESTSGRGLLGKLFGK
ncbi:MAG: hypothetical protein PHI06_14830 [Desulfobulbaceae bacterium]|nr:hypothetical protein [Desulfobulbaceae bacterium]